MEVIVDQLIEIRRLQRQVDLLDTEGWSRIDLQVLHAAQILVQLMNTQRHDTNQKEQPR